MVSMAPIVLGLDWILVNSSFSKIIKAKLITRSEKGRRELDDTGRNLSGMGDSIL